MRILLVEDDNAIQELLAELLRGEGYQVDTAMSVAEGFASLELAAPDVLLVDVRLGDGDGRRLIVHCRTDERLGKLSIIVMTAAPWHDEGNELSVTAVIPKPFDINDFVAAVKVAATVTGTEDSSVLH
jgi:two-component system, OmpR family, phosphate regulon response regulator OmpR